MARDIGNFDDNATLQLRLELRLSGFENGNCRIDLKRRSLEERGPLRFSRFDPAVSGRSIRQIAVPGSFRPLEETLMRKWLPELIVLVAFAASIVVYGRLPEQLPVHWDMNGNPNGWAPQPFGAFLAPVLLLVIAAIKRFAPDLDPRQDNYSKFWQSLEALYVEFLLLVLVMHVMSLGLALGYHVPVRQVVTTSSSSSPAR